MKYFLFILALIAINPSRADSAEYQNETVLSFIVRPLALMWWPKIRPPKPLKAPRNPSSGARDMSKFGDKQPFGANGRPNSSQQKRPMTQGEMSSRLANIERAKKEFARRCPNGRCSRPPVVVKPHAPQSCEKRDQPNARGCVGKAPMGNGPAKARPVNAPLEKGDRISTAKPRRGGVTVVKKNRT